MKKGLYRSYVRNVDNADIILGVEDIAHLHCYVSRYIYLGLVLEGSKRKKEGGMGREGGGEGDENYMPMVA